MNLNHLIKSLFSNASLYIFANFLRSGISFVLLPVYTRYFTKAEFAAMDQIIQAVATGLLVFSFGLPQGLVRGFYLSAPNESERRLTAGALFSFLMPVYLGVGFLMVLFASNVGTLLFAGEGTPMWIYLTGPCFVIYGFHQFPAFLLRTQQRAKVLVTWATCGFLLAVGLNLTFIVYLKMGLVGMLIANIVAPGFTAVFLGTHFFRYAVPNFSFSRLRPLFAFGLPFIPGMLGRKALEISGRYMLPHYGTLDELAILVMALKIAMILNTLVLLPFLNAWQPFFYSQAGNAEAKELFGRVTLHLLLAVAVLVLGIETVKEWLLGFLGSGKYDAAAPLTSILLVGFFFNGMQYAISPGIHLKKKLPQEAGLMVLAAGAAVLLNIVLIPRFGAYGAAIAQAAGFLIYFVATFLLAQSVYPVQYPVQKMALVTAITFACMIGMQFISAPLLRWALFSLALTTFLLVDSTLVQFVRSRLTYMIVGGSADGESR